MRSRTVHEQPVHEQSCFPSEHRLGHSEPSARRAPPLRAASARRLCAPPLRAVRAASARRPRGVRAAPEGPSRRAGGQQ